VNYRSPVPVPGKPHLRRREGKWEVVVSAGVWPTLNAMALRAARTANELPLAWPVCIFHDPAGPQLAP